MLSREAGVEYKVNGEDRSGRHVTPTLAHSSSNRDLDSLFQKGHRRGRPFIRQSRRGVNVGICILPGAASKREADDWSVLPALSSNLRGRGRDPATSPRPLPVRELSSLWRVSHNSFGYTAVECLGSIAGPISLHNLCLLCVMRNQCQNQIGFQCPHRKLSASQFSKPECFYL